MADAGFPGFTPQALQFLVDLGQNNDRAWFQPRKAEYERLLKAPLEALCTALGEAFAARGIPLGVRSRQVAVPHLPRRALLQGQVALQDGRQRELRVGREGGGVGGYFHLQPGHVYVGGGMWHPSPARLAAWRAAVVADRAAVHAVIDAPAFAAMFGTLDGDRLQRAPSGYRADDPDLDLLRLKDITFGRGLADADACSPDLPATVADTLARAVPLLRLLATLPGHEAPVGWLRD